MYLYNFFRIHQTGYGDDDEDGYDSDLAAPVAVAVAGGGSLSISGEGGNNNSLTIGSGSSATTNAELDGSSSNSTQSNSMIHAMEEAQLVMRTEFLQSRVTEVDLCESIVEELVTNYKYMRANNLQEIDMTMKRAQLTPQVII